MDNEATCQRADAGRDEADDGRGHAGAAALRLDCDRVEVGDEKTEQEKSGAITPMNSQKPAALKKDATKSTAESAMKNARKTGESGDAQALDQKGVGER